MFTLKIKRKALRTLEKIDSHQKQKIKSAILILKNDPLPFKKTDISKLKGYDNTYRIRLGSTRIVYEVMWKESIILIHYVGPRKKAYE